MVETELQKANVTVTETFSMSVAFVEEIAHLALVVLLILLANMIPLPL